MQTENKKRNVKPYQGILVFVLVILMLILVANPIQIRWGMYGVAITEILILLLGLVPALLLKVDLKEMLPIKAPKIREIFGVLFLWCGSSLASVVVVLITGLFFPEDLGQVSDYMENTITSIPFFVSFIIVAVMPAICEEVLHRGFILFTFRQVKSKWIVVLIMGLIFGLFHLHPMRFASTGILGMALAYIMIETKNMLLPILFHFINNGFSSLVTFINQGKVVENTTDLEVPSVTVMTIGAFLIIGVVIPFLILIGSNLLHKKVSNLDSEAMLIMKKRKRKNLVIAGVCSLVLLITGIGMMAYSMGQAPVFKTSMKSTLTNKAEDLEIPMEVETTGNYFLTLILKSEKVSTKISIVTEQGEETYNIEAKEVINSKQLTLEAGDYQLFVEYSDDDLAKLGENGESDWLLEVEIR